MSRRAPFVVVFFLSALGIIWLCAWVLGVPPFKEETPSLVRVEYQPQQPLVIAYEKRGTIHIFYGSLPMSDCQVLASGISASGTSTVHVVLALQTLAPTAPCGPDLASTTAVQEFEAAFTTDREAVLDGVTINSKPVEYTIN